MFLFPVIYILSFLISAYEIYRGRLHRVLIFFIFGLSIYITSLSLTYKYGFRNWIPYLQSFKEVLIFCCLGVLVWTMKRRIRFHIIDILVLSYLAYTLLYIFLPIGDFTMGEKLIAFKSISIFPFIYFTGRLLDPGKIKITEYFHYICVVAIAAAVVLLFEIVPGRQLQTMTGYTDYNYFFFNQPETGRFGLSFTFETDTGLKRYASFFSMPLEHAAATILCISVLIGMVTDDKRRLKINNFILLTFACTFLSILFALSRASFLSYFIMLYLYALITQRKNWLKTFHYGVLALLIAGLFWIQGDVVSFVQGTLDFSNDSSVTHLLDWLAAIDAITSYPFGMGLAASGRVAGTLGASVGGENQLLIIGVQCGVIAMILYAAIYTFMIKYAFRFYRVSLGPAKKLALVVFLLKIGLIIPLLTSEAESYSYVSFITWFFSGLLISMMDRYNNGALEKGFIGRFHHSL